MSKPMFSKSGKFFAKDGFFYGQSKTEKGEGWRKLECYLPSATGTYGEPLETTAARWLDEFDAGTRRKSFLGGFCSISQDGDVFRLDSDGNPIIPKPRGQHFKKAKVAA